MPYSAVRLIDTRTYRLRERERLLLRAGDLERERERLLSWLRDRERLLLRLLDRERLRLLLRLLERERERRPRLPPPETPAGPSPRSSRTRMRALQDGRGQVKGHDRDTSIRGFSHMT